MLPCAPPLIIFVALKRRRDWKQRGKKKKKRDSEAATDQKACGIFNKHTDYTVIHHIFKIALCYWQIFMTAGRWTYEASRFKGVVDNMQPLNVPFHLPPAAAFSSQRRRCSNHLPSQVVAHVNIPNTASKNWQPLQGSDESHTQR